jgi:hypothetical protein
MQVTYGLKTRCRQEPEVKILALSKGRNWLVFGYTPLKWLSRRKRKRSGTTAGQSYSTNHRAKRSAVQKDDHFIFIFNHYLAIE